MNRLFGLARFASAALLLVGCSASPAGNTDPDRGGSGTTTGSADSGLARGDSEAAGQNDGGTIGHPVEGGTAACATVANLRVTSTSTASIALAWEGGPGTTATISRKTYCGGDAYVALTTLPAGVATYTDTSVTAQWVYWYEVTVTDAAGGTASGAMAAQAASSGALGCGGGGTPSPSGVPACETVADAGAPVEAGAGGAPVAITATTPGAAVISPGGDVAAAVQACSTGTVHFSAGTYNLSGTIHIPANCQLEGDLNWGSIITGSGNPVFQLDTSANVTITRLQFQNIDGGVITNDGGNGVGSAPLTGTHIYLNLFDHITSGNPILLWDPSDLTIERNAFNYIQADSIHLFSNTTASGVYDTKFPSSNVNVRWNFAANQNFQEVDFNGGPAFIESQLGTTGFHFYQNVYYSQSNWQGMAFSLPNGTEPCTDATFKTCLAPENGTNAIFIDGNITLDNGIGALTGSTNGFMSTEINGTGPIVQNNFFRGWMGNAMYANIFQYDSASGTYTYGTGTGPGTPPITFQNNTECATFSVMTSADMIVSEQSGFQATIVASGSNASPTCANVAPPPLPPQCVVPPDLLDSSGGLNALTNSMIPGPNTYWPNANQYLNFVFP